MELKKDTTVWIFDGNMLYTGIIIEPYHEGYRVCYTSGFLKGEIAWQSPVHLFTEKGALVDAMNSQIRYIEAQKEYIKAGMKII